MNSTPPIDHLIADLDNHDPHIVKEAGEALAAIGAPAIPALVKALEGSFEARKAASFVLGRVGRGHIDTLLEPLLYALRDDEPKVRKNVSVTLGRLVSSGPAGSRHTRHDDVIRALGAALEIETVVWVRTSMVLAIGALGGGVAAAVLRDVRPASDEEAEALDKARDRTRPASKSVAWRADVELNDSLWAAVPVGLEDVAQAEAIEAGFDVTGIEYGFLQLAGARDPQTVLDRMRCCYDARLLVYEGRSLRQLAPHEVPRRLAEMVADSTRLADWRHVIDTPDADLRYRFALRDLKLSREGFLEALRQVRACLLEVDMRDSPSGYSVGLEVEVTARDTRIWLVPTFLRDDRFDYRYTDVGAAIHPVVAAGLARWNRQSGTQTVFDPCCGSGTLLIERAKLDPDIALYGIDISPTAVESAQTNIEAAGLSDRITVLRRDAAEQRSWRDVDEVMANLPFGLRSRQQDRDLGALYYRMVGHLESHLAPRGRAVFYTSYRRQLNEALFRRGRDLEVVDTLDIESGGLHISAVGLAQRRASR